MPDLYEKMYSRSQETHPRGGYGTKQKVMVEKGSINHNAEVLTRLWYISQDKENFTEKQINWWDGLVDKNHSPFH